MTQSLDQQNYELACSMEQPFWTIHDLLTTIDLITPALVEDGADHVGALQRLVQLAQKEWEQAEEMRAQLFHLNHPRREQLAKERADESR